MTKLPIDELAELRIIGPRHTLAERRADERVKSLTRKPDGDISIIFVAKAADALRFRNVVLTPTITPMEDLETCEHCIEHRACPNCPPSSPCANHKRYIVSYHDNIMREHEFESRTGGACQGMDTTVRHETPKISTFTPTNHEQPSKIPMTGIIERLRKLDIGQHKWLMERLTSDHGPEGKAAFMAAYKVFIKEI